MNEEETFYYLEILLPSELSVWYFESGKDVLTDPNRTNDEYQTRKTIENKLINEIIENNLLKYSTKELYSCKLRILCCIMRLLVENAESYCSELTKLTTAPTILSSSTDSASPLLPFITVSTTKKYVNLPDSITCKLLFILLLSLSCFDTNKLQIILTTLSSTGYHNSIILLAIMLEKYHNSFPTFILAGLYTYIDNTWDEKLCYHGQTFAIMLRLFRREITVAIPLCYILRKMYVSTFIDHAIPQWAYHPDTSIPISLHDMVCFHETNDEVLQIIIPEYVRWLPIKISPTIESTTGLYLRLLKRYNQSSLGFDIFKISLYWTMCNRGCFKATYRTGTG